jgi:hypothetical protein
MCLRVGACGRGSRASASGERQRRLRVSAEASGFGQSSTAHPDALEDEEVFSSLGGLAVRKLVRHQSLSYAGGRFAGRLIPTSRCGTLGSR